MSDDFEIDLLKEKCFDFTCPYCKSKKIDMKPLNVPYTIKVKDMSKSRLDDSTKERFEQIEPLFDILLECEKKDVICHCDDCNTAFTPKDKLSSHDVGIWLKEKYGEDCLGSKKHMF
jgi:hypothetical protein